MAYTLNDGQAKPYVYQEYPRRMYKAGEKPCSVGSDEARAEKEAEGWSIDHSLQPAAVTTGAPLVAGAQQTGETLTVECTTEADVEAPRRSKPKKGRA